MKKFRIFITITMMVFLLGLSLSVNAQTPVISGLKTPRLTTAQRNQIPVAGNAAASGLVIYNTDTNTLQYWNGTTWVNSSGDITALVDSITNNITQQFSDSVWVHMNYPAIVDTLTNYITNNFADSVWVHINYPAVIDTLTNYITNNFADSVWVHMNYPSIIDTLSNYVTQQFTDSVMANVTLTGQNGIIVSGSGTSNLYVGLPAGTKSGQILEWSEQEGKWIVSNSNSDNQIKELEISISSNNVLKTNSLIFSGSSEALTKAIKIVNVQPIITGNALMKKTMLSVDATASYNPDDTTVDWIINIENHNIENSKTCTLSKVIISYISAETLVSDDSSIEVFEQVGW